jgi:peptide/nickel transport system ATP-binding protein
MREDLVLRVADATVEFKTAGGIIRALDDVSLHVRQGETLALVGESGCGKTTLARAVLGLESLAAGEIHLGLSRVQGKRRGVAEQVGMVWQDPNASLDPRWPIERSVLEPALLAGRKVDLGALLDEVGLDSTYIGRYPHQLSGGQRQRVAIARALALRPGLVICDEPTAALDLSVRAQILNLLRVLQQDIGCSFLYISHDLVTVRFLADRIAVMYLGRIVEEGPSELVFSEPRHPYTAALLESAPTLEKLGHIPAQLPGELPDPRTRFVGCRFEGRCPNARERCRREDPAASTIGERRFWCHFPVETGAAAGAPKAGNSASPGSCSSA